MNKAKGGVVLLFIIAVIGFCIAMFGSKEEYSIGIVSSEIVSSDGMTVKVTISAENYIDENLSFLVNISAYTKRDKLIASKFITISIEPYQKTEFVYYIDSQFSDRDFYDSYVKIGNIVEV